jgi:hypothetical protein
MGCGSSKEPGHELGSAGADLQSEDTAEAVALQTGVAECTSKVRSGIEPLCGIFCVADEFAQPSCTISHWSMFTSR